MRMKKTERKYLLMAIRKNAVSFFAVAFIAAISIAIYLGLQAASTATLKSADHYMVTNKLATFEISCANGITPEDIDAVASWEGADQAEGGYSAVVQMDSERENLVLQALSLGSSLNVPRIMEGTLPQAADEAAVEERLAKKHGIAVGDEITLMHSGNLKSDTFRVTAVINLPMFCCSTITDARGMSTTGLGSAAFYIGLSQEAFDASYYKDCFTTAYVRTDAFDDVYYYSEEYEEKETALKEQYEKLGAERAALRYEELLQEAQPAIDAGLMQADEISMKDWIFTVRGDMGDLRGLRTLVNSTYGLSYAMSIIFVLVAIVVCHAAISRMISEQRSLIGAQKAMGFTAGEILKHFMYYNTLCAVLGIVLGYVIGIGIVEGIVVFIFGGEFLLERIALIITWKEAVMAAGLCLAIFLITTYTACKKLSREPATALLRGEVPGQMKPFFFEKWGVYRKLNLYSRSMIKNVLKDKGRMLTTIMGVVGCISLLIICFSLKMGIENSSVVQFESYFLYDHRLVMDSSRGSAEEFGEILDAEEIPYMQIQDRLKTFRVDAGAWESCRIAAADDFEKLKDFMVLEDITTGKTAEVPEHGALVSRKCAEIFGLSEGSRIEVMDSEGNPKEMVIAGVIEHYLSYHFFVTTTAYYEEVMGEAADTSVFLLNGIIDGLYEKVREKEGFLSLKDNSESAAKAEQVNMVIGLCLALAAAMSLLVLLNQITMHINRKSRELAVMRINGYTLKETKAYVYKDNIVLTIMGLLLGCVFGSGLSWVVIRIMEGEVNRYVRTPNMTAWLYSCAVGALFALIVNLIALRRINTLNLTNVNGN